VAVANGVHRVGGDARYYWCEIPRPEARALVDHARREGWRDALQLLKPALAEEIGRPGRALWKHFLPLGEDSDILDFGAGWGALSVSLARTFRSVTAVDLTLERCEFTAIRAGQEGRDNVVVLHTGGGRTLPFPDEAYDLIVLNGVLEWLPDSAPGHPRDVQVAYLREVSRVLRPGGLVYVGIENRFSYAYWLGREEEHAHIPYVSLLPRGLANWYARRRIGKDYRTWTYGLSGYRRLLARSGMRLERVLYPAPDYRWIETVLPLDDRHTMLSYYRTRGAGLRRFVRRLLIASGAFARLVPSYGLVGRKPA
jgi:SAM-dependent methyltransferase